jgi:2-polyprenyl-3-methyl-5-hydroxy-6-metoxy-1,4-benzoquinol methylase
VKALSAAELEVFFTPLHKASAAAVVAERIGCSRSRARHLLRNLCGEARAGLMLLDWAGVQPGWRILEVGAGGGLLTAFLQSSEFDVVAIDPAGQGFELSPSLARAVAEILGVAPRILHLAASELDRRQIGTFDLIFSVNVIEHLQPMDTNLDGLARVMAGNGSQVHTCPNYRVPYEPHFGIPLIPLAPWATPYFGRRTLLQDKLWRSLNFITVSDLRAYAKRHRLKILFRSGTIAEAMNRLLHEPAFAGRHPTVLRRAARLAQITGLNSLLAKLPPIAATPMTVRLWRDAENAA